MAQCVAQGVRQSGAEARIWSLCDFSILPCMACGACFHSAEQGCVLEGKDDAQRLFALLEADAPVVVTAPIFFYHVPAQLKAFMDRGQKYWARQEKHGLPMGQAHEKKLHVALVAARKQGDNLFSGSLASLKLFAQLFQRNMGEVSLWKGYDGPQDFTQDVAACEVLRRMGRNIV